MRVGVGHLPEAPGKLDLLGVPDLVLSAEEDDLVLQQRGPDLADGRVAQSLRDIGFYSGSNLLATFAGRAEDLKGWTNNAIINRDRGLKLQYLAGLGLNLYKANDIYQNMVAAGVKMPQGMFVGTPETVDLLSRMIESGQFR